MIDFGWLNIGSLVLGIIAWGVPVVSLMKDKKRGSRHWMAVSILSFSACGISLCFQLFYTYHKVVVQDWAALMDTMYAVSAASAVLLIVTILLNAVTLKYTAA
ncbi:hypothetical protein LCL89_10085 [Halobacillus yeomjeoni]|uniref:hypothetical protein n=1 Tax=Halobacillus yeomjeoni TaxID=311194 RepID=UPI001CD3571E|nr:hypothetical protein [Halobacillus yeomjeoni]MCA0984394.1 hypothetical protein [Halobacillus yeomjeoni]